MEQAKCRSDAALWTRNSCSAVQSWEADDDARQWRLTEIVSRTRKQRSSCRTSAASHQLSELASGNMCGFDRSGNCQRGIRRRRGGDPLIVLVRIAALKIRLNRERTCLDVPRAVRRLRRQ